MASFCVAIVNFEISPVGQTERADERGIMRADQDEFVGFDFGALYNYFTNVAIINGTIIYFRYQLIWAEYLKLAS